MENKSQPHSMFNPERRLDTNPNTAVENYLFSLRIEAWTEWTLIQFTSLIYGSSKCLWIYNINTCLLYSKLDLNFYLYDFYLIYIFFMIIFLQSMWVSSKIIIFNVKLTFLCFDFSLPFLLFRNYFFLHLKFPIKE